LTGARVRTLAEADLTPGVTADVEDVWVFPSRSSRLAEAYITRTREPEEILTPSISVFRPT
jgi:hypothetical protein